MYNNQIYIRFIYSMPWKFVCDLWFHEVFTNNNVQADNERK